MSQAGQFYPSGLIETLTGDTGGAVSPTAGNIDLVGGAGVTVDGTPGTSTLTINISAVAALFPTDAGTAVPLAGELDILGGTNINTTGVGNTVTVVLDDDVTLAGQLEANEIESITYITAGTNITAVTGNISAPGGDVVAGGNITATGDITTTTGDLNATTGDLDVGGAANVVGNITSSMGDVIAQDDVIANTGDIIATLGGGDFNTTVVAGTGITATTGNIVASSGNMSASGTITAGSGFIATTGGILISAGDLTVTLGDIETLAGSIDSASTISAVSDITSTAGNVIAQNNVSAITGDVIAVAGGGDFNTTVVAGTGITATTGNITATAGDIITTIGSIDSGSTISAVGDITTSTGDLVSTLGDIRAPNGTLFVATFSATGDIITTGGNLQATIGDVIAGDQVLAGNGVVASGGNIVASTGNINASAGSMTANQNITSINGAIVAPMGDITSGFDVVAGADISSILGDITAEQGDLLARYDIESVEGDIVAQAGDIYTLGGFIRSAGAVIADVNLKASGTVQFPDITDGGLIADSSGFVSSSAALLIFTGFATWTGAGAYYDDSVLGSFEVLRGGTGYIDSLLVTWAGGQTVTGMTAGNTYLIYIDDTGTIGKTTAFTQAVFEDYIVLFECLRDSTGTNIQYTVKENHPYNFAPAISFYNHEIIGTVIENNAQGANITLNGTQKIEIVGADELSDHGLYTDIPDSGGVAETWMQMLTNGAGKWITYQTSDTFNGYWNSAGTATAPSGNKYSVYTLYVSKDDLNAATPTYWAVLNDAEYNNLAGANTAISNGLISRATAELAKLEISQLGYIIYQQSISTIVEVIIAKDTLRSTISSGAGTSIAALITTDVTNFDGILSAADTTVQASLETIDEWGKTTTDHAILIGNGTGSPIGSLTVGTDGQVIVGSTGVDPVFANITSTDSSITVTEGAGTLALTGTQSTVTQLGSVELATDAESIAGTDSDRPIVPSSLAAKLGTQTDHGVIVGSGSTAALTALTVGTNGQVLVGSAAADPVFANITSTDSSITVTEGAGTLAITGTQSTVTQLGSVELATDAESIAGTDTDRPIVPSSLAAKLGTQTDHGVLVGSGTAAAVTALTVGTDGQVIVGSTGADPVFATIASADASIDITGGAGTIDLSATGTVAINAQTGTTYTLVIADEGKLVTCSNGAAITLTVPNNAAVAFPTGTNILIAQKGAGVVTFAPGGGVTINSRGAALNMAGQYAMASLTKEDTDVWYLAGDVA